MTRQSRQGPHQHRQPIEILSHWLKGILCRDFRLNLQHDRKPRYKIRSVTKDSQQFWLILFFPDPISDSATTIPMQNPLLSSDRPQTQPVFDPLRLLSPLEKDCPRLQSTSENSIRTFIASYKEYRRAGGNNCLYCVNDLISIYVRQNLRMSSVQDPYALRSDEEWLSFLILRIPKSKLYLLLPCNMRR